MIRLVLSLMAMTTLAACSPQYNYAALPLEDPNSQVFRTVPNGVIPPEDYEVQYPRELAMEGYALSNYIARSCPSYGVDETKLFHFFKVYDLLPEDVQAKGKAYATYRDGRDLFAFQDQRTDLGAQGCSLGDKLHLQEGGNPGWILRKLG